MHLVIVTREDPPLPLSRLRARGDTVEIRQADLRFTEEETADFLRTVLVYDWVNVVEFGREKQELENVFMELIQEEENDVC